MVILGLILIVLAVLTILAGVFGNDGSAEFLGFEISSVSIFLIGAVAGVAVMWGYGLTKWGTKRGLAHRQERKELLKMQREQEKAPAPTQQPSAGDDRTPPPTAPTAGS